MLQVCRRVHLRSILEKCLYTPPNLVLSVLFSTSSSPSLYPKGAVVPIDFPSLPPRKLAKPRKQPSKMQRPIGALPPLVAIHPQMNNRSLKTSVPGIGKTLSTRELASLRASWGVTGEKDGEGNDSGSQDAEVNSGREDSRNFTPSIRALRMRRLVFPATTVSNPLDRLFAVVSVKGKQFKVSPGDVINAEKLKGAKVGDVLSLPPMVVGSRDKTLLGRPTVQGASVSLTVQEHVQDLKVIVFKKKRRKRYQKKNGFRRQVTRLRVDSIDANMDAH